MKKILTVLLIILLSSCVSQEAKHINNLYNRLQTISTGTNQHYYYYSTDNIFQSLIIYIEGSGLTSVLGSFNKEKIESVTYAYVILDQYGRSNSVLVPEKPHMVKGGKYNNDEKVLHSYTVEKSY